MTAERICEILIIFVKNLQLSSTKKQNVYCKENDILLKYNSYYNVEIITNISCISVNTFFLFSVANSVKDEFQMCGPYTLCWKVLVEIM